MSLHGPFVIKSSQTAIDDDMIDDSTGIIPMAGLKTPMPLSSRFVNRLATMTAASVELVENKTEKSITIHISRNTGSPQPRVESDTVLRDFFQSMKHSMILIAKHRSGEICERGVEELWECILMYSYLNVDHVVESIQACFSQNETTFEEFLTKMFGILDHTESRSTLDRELGDRLIFLNQAVRSYDKSMKQLHSLIRYASDMIKKIQSLQDRLKYLLQKSRFADTLFKLICTLGFPERAHNTFVRAAKSTLSFTNITTHIKPIMASPRRGRSIAPSATSSATTTAPNRAKRASDTIPTASSQTTTNTASTSPSQRTTQPSQKPPQNPLETPQQNLPSPTPDRREPIKPEPNHEKDTFAVIRPYLAEEDQLPELSVSKQDTVRLLQAVLNGNLLQISTNAWYRFGFVTARDEEEERQIGGLYAAILKEAHNKALIFSEIAHAMGTNTMSKLFDAHGWGHFGQELPQLDLFLNTPPHQRPTVWCLKQFLQIDGDPEPPAALQRDYGFKFCRQREEVYYLKAVYAQMLAHVGPIKLHHACIYGRLYDTARQRGVTVDPKYKRLMENDYPAPCVGFDNDDGLAAYRGRFYKRG